MDSVKNKTSFAFNRICINFLKEIKNQDINLKKKIKKNYKVFNKSSHDHIQYFWKKVLPINDILQSDNINCEELLVNQDFCDIYIMKGIQIGNLLNIFTDEKSTILSYILTLYLFAYLYNDITEDNFEDIDILLHKVLTVVNSITDDSIEDNDITKLLEDILDDNVKQIIATINKLKIQMIDNLDVDEDILNMGKYTDLIEGSKIGEIAKSICGDLKGIDLDPSLTPQEMISSLFNGSNNVIGNLIETVGTSLTSKIESGELNQTELLGDAFKLLGQLNSDDSQSGGFMNSLMKQVVGSMSGSTSTNEDGADMMDTMNLFASMASMTNGTTEGKIDQNKVAQVEKSNKTKDRLRKKLADKEKSK
jgi:hypothetical protein